MPRRFIKPRIDRLFRDSVEGLVDDLSKKSRVEAVTAGAPTYCNNCVFDPVHKASSGVYNNNGPKPFDGKVCPVCRGKGVLSIERHLVVPAIVQWGKAEPTSNDRPLPEGSLPKEFARLKAKVRFWDTVTKADYFLVDGVRCKIVGLPVKRGLQTHVILEWVVAT